MPESGGAGTIGEHFSYTNYLTFPLKQQSLRYKTYKRKNQATD